MRGDGVEGGKEKRREIKRISWEVDAEGDLSREKDKAERLGSADRLCSSCHM